MFRSICPPAFFRSLLNSGTYTELQITFFIESMGSPVLIPLALTGTSVEYSGIVTRELLDKHLKKAETLKK